LRTLEKECFGCFKSRFAGFARFLRLKTFFKLKTLEKEDLNVSKADLELTDFLKENFAYVLVILLCFVSKYSTYKGNSVTYLDLLILQYQKGLSLTRS